MRRPPPEDCHRSAKRAEPPHQPVDPKQQQVLIDLAHIMHDSRQIASDIAAGRGTVGGFIKDPTFYENLTALLEGARRSWILRTVIQSTVNKGQEGER